MQAVWNFLRSHRKIWQGPIIVMVVVIAIIAIAALVARLLPHIVAML